MMPTIATAPYFNDESAAFDFLEAVRWPQLPSCPHCGRVGHPYDLRRTRIGLKKCRSCYRQFTVRIGTLFESTHIPTHKWLQIVFLLRGCGGAIGPTQLRKIVGVSYRTAWRVGRQLRLKVGGRSLPSAFDGFRDDLFAQAVSLLIDDRAEERFVEALSQCLHETASSDRSNREAMGSSQPLPVTD